MRYQPNIKLHNYTNFRGGDISNLVETVMGNLGRFAWGEDGGADIHVFVRSAEKQKRELIKPIDCAIQGQGSICLEISETCTKSDFVEMLIPKMIQALGQRVRSDIEVSKDSLRQDIKNSWYKLRAKEEPQAKTKRLLAQAECQLASRKRSAKLLAEKIDRYERYTAKLRNNLKVMNERTAEIEQRTAARKTEVAATA